MQQSGKSYKNIVIKIGASLLFGKDSGQDRLQDALEELSGQVRLLNEGGIGVVIVSSGAIASGMRLLQMKQRPKELGSLQATAAVGQHFLMSQYQRFFEKEGLNCAQVLLTYDDFTDRKRCLNARNTLLTLLKMKTIPVVNENDTISTDEIKFGDNDTLSGRVASFIDADLLIILSDVDGLLDRDKKVISVVDGISPEIKALACSTNKQACVGGMVTKLEAAKIAVDSGIPCVIANGLKLRDGIIIKAIKEPERYGTLFIPRKGYDAKERWLAFGTKPKGRITVDEGAKKALINNKSLLSVGVCGLEGSFECGDIVSIVDKQGIEVARGKAGLSCRQLDKFKGQRCEKEAVHRDDIVIL